MSLKPCARGTDGTTETVGHWGPRLQEGFCRCFYSLDLAWLLEGGRPSQKGSLRGGGLQAAVVGGIQFSPT